MRKPDKPMRPLVAIVIIHYIISYRILIKKRLKMRKKPSKSMRSLIPIIRIT